MTVHFPQAKAEYGYPTAFSNWSDEEKTAMARVHLSGRYTMGAEVEAFEAEFAAYHGRKHCIMVNSGSSANLVMVQAFAHRFFHMGTVTLPALAWATTYAPLLQAGSKIKLADCDDTWNEERGLCSIQTPILGNPCGHAGAVLEDCCESVGARDNKGKLSGTFGIAASFSFFHSHQLSAIEGGAVLTDDDDLARFCRLLRNHGWTKGLDAPKSFAEEYQFVLAGYNLRPLELHAAIARAQLRKLDVGAAARRKNWKFFASLAQGLSLKLQEITSPDGFNPFCIAFTVPTEEIRETLAKALRAEGIDCRPAVGGSFRLQPYGKDYSGPATPNADNIHRTGMCIGCAPFQIEDKIEKAVGVMRKFL